MTGSLPRDAPYGPFAGLRVVEFGRFIAVPYCGQLLADAGADVVKVEPLSGDQSRSNGVLPGGTSRQFLNKNRGKRSCALDLSHPEMAGPLERLVGTADVVLANFRPGVAERLGLDYPSVSARNPRVIYAENTAFGPAGPLAGAVGVDMAVQAYSGLWHATPAGPQPVAEPIIDYMAAMLMAFGVSTALYHRQRTGRGQRLDTALLQAAMLLQNNHLVGVAADEAWRGELCQWLETAFSEGRSWEEIIDRRQAATGEASDNPYYGLIGTSDGYLAVGAGGADLRAKVRALIASVSSAPGDPGPAVEPDGADAVRACFASRPSATWLSDFARIGVPAAPLRFRERLFDDAQVEANGFLAHLAHPRLGEVVAVGPPLRMTETPLVAGAPPPALGAHTVDVLSEIGVPLAEVQALAARGAIGVAEPEEVGGADGSG